jgi:hypothetical protein
LASSGARCATGWGCQQWTLIDDEGWWARIGADHLGHSKVSMTQDRYMSRGRAHSEVASSEVGLFRVG